MKPPIRFAAALYPARWRARYGAEFAALLDDSGANWHDFFDILRGALLMRLQLPRPGRLLIATAAAGVALAAWFAFRIPNDYMSIAVMRLQPQPGNPDLVDLNQLNRAQQEVLSRSTLSAILMRENIYQRERTTLPLEDIVQEMRNKYIQVRTVGPANNAEKTGIAFTVAFQYPDRYKAQAVTNDLTAAFVRAAAHSGASGLQLLDPPTLPQSPASPNRVAIIAAGLVLGLAAGLLSLGIRRWPLVAACGIAAAGVAFAGSYLVPDRWSSTAVIDADRNAYSSVAATIADRNYLWSVVQKLNLYPRERAKESVDQVIQRMRTDLTVRSVSVPTHPNTGFRQALVISYAGEGSRYTVQAVTRELVAHVIATNSAAPAPTVLAVLDPPNVPDRPLAPNRGRWSLLGLLAGMLLGVTWTLVARPRAPAANHA